MTAGSDTPRADLPAQLAALRARTVVALGQLAELGSDDPAAGSAMRAVRLTCHTLEWFWLPALDARIVTTCEHRPG